ncbi:MAG: hypothetical protein KY468_08545, partial [Armatimonadetes bacterium]|nr:hypothetical protein [Armatimonadota bacterium]
MEAITALYSDNRERRIAIYLRPDGCYTYRKESLCRHDGEEWWISDDELECPGIYDSPETAMREALTSGIWLDGNS